VGARLGAFGAFQVTLTEVDPVAAAVTETGLPSWTEPVDEVSVPPASHEARVATAKRATATARAGRKTKRRIRPWPRCSGATR
jgi:hypothetical protein